MNSKQLTTSRQLYGQVTVDNDTVSQLVCIRHAHNVSAWTHCKMHQTTLLYQYLDYVFICVVHVQLLIFLKICQLQISIRNISYKKPICQ